MNSEKEMLHAMSERMTRLSEDFDQVIRLLSNSLFGPTS